MKVLLFSALSILFVVVSGFWDDATSTAYPAPKDDDVRQSFFRWQEVQPSWRSWFFWGWDYSWLEYNRRLNVVCGLSYKFICIGTGTILNRRTVLTACNLIEEYYHIPRELRIWALGARGEYYTPYRYRVWRFTRLFPRSLNPEHLHGYRGTYSPRHDVCVIHSLDQMMTTFYLSRRGHYPHRSYLINDWNTLTQDLWHTGSGYENLQHVQENYKIYITKVQKSNIVNCRKWLPKWWGRFFCIINEHGFPGIQNGAGFHSVGWDNTDYIAGLGCFEIRYNEDKVLVFTDLRYYVKLIAHVAYIYPGEYYEYAYPQWGMHFGYLYNSIYANSPRIPHWQIMDDLYPLG